MLLRLVKVFSLLLALLASLLLAYLWHRRNEATVEIDYFIGILSLPLSVSVFLALILGLALGVLLSGLLLLNMNLRLALLRRRLAAVRKRSRR